MSEIKDYVVYPDDIKIYVPPTIPEKQSGFYKSLASGLCSAISKVAIRGGSTIEKINMEGLKPPYIVLSNHTQFADFLVSFRAVRPFKFNNIATIANSNENANGTKYIKANIVSTTINSISNTLFSPF